MPRKVLGLVPPYFLKNYCESAYIEVCISTNVMASAWGMARIHAKPSFRFKFKVNAKANGKVSIRVNAKVRAKTNVKANAISGYNVNDGQYVKASAS